MQKKARSMNLVSFCSVSRSSQKWVGTLLFLSSSKGSPQEQQEDFPPSQIRMDLVAHQKLNLELSICALLQKLGNPNVYTRWPALRRSLRGLKLIKRGDKHHPKPAPLSPHTRPLVSRKQIPKKGICLIHPPPHLIHAPWGAWSMVRPAQGNPRSVRWVGSGSGRVGLGLAQVGPPIRSTLSAIH